MNYTPNFHLPQWDKDDRIMMDDFNQMASTLESALSQNQAAAATAQTAAGAAQETANETKDTLRTYTKIKTGMYRGNGGRVTIDLGAMPGAVFIAGRPASLLTALENDVTHKYSGIMVLEGTTACGRISETGFTVIAVDKADCPNLNASNYYYAFTAIC